MLENNSLDGFWRMYERDFEGISAASLHLIWLSFAAGTFACTLYSVPKTAFFDKIAIY